MWGYWKFDNSRCFVLIAIIAMLIPVCYPLPLWYDTENGYGLNTLQSVRSDMYVPNLQNPETFQRKRAVFRMGKRAMMRFGKRAMMRFGKRAVLRLG